MFEGFTLARVNTGEAGLRVRIGGAGPPLLLLHGHPQTHVMWHRIAPRLAQDFTVVAPDLRGYGESSKPKTTGDHEPYSKRAMARDMVSLMEHLGFDEFAVAGHDRGGRCAYRLALDHPERVTKLAVLDIIPTGEAWRRADREFGMVNWHWYFMAQPYDMPERMLGSDPDRNYLPHRDIFDPEALADYLRCIKLPGTIHAMCEDYRAGATCDRDLEDTDRGRIKITCPLLVLWARQEELERFYDPIAIWKDWADDVQGTSLDCGHYLAEEAPDDTCAHLHAFFTGIEDGPRQSI